MCKLYILSMFAKNRPEKNLNARGLTLVELLVVVILLGIVAGIAFPSYQRMAINGHLKTAARDIIADFNSLREMAMANNTQLTLAFNVGSNQYTSTALPTKSPANIASDIRLASATFGGGTTVTFMTRGTILTGGNVVLTNGRGSTATITCNIAGRTYVSFNMQ